MDDAKQKDAVRDILESFWAEPTPDLPPEFEMGFALGAQAAEIRREVDKWEAMSEATPTDGKTKKDELKRLNAELQKILKQIRDIQDKKVRGQENKNANKTKPESSITEAVKLPFAASRHKIGSNIHPVEARPL